MNYTMLGDTGVKVSVAGLGCGGNSRLGMRVGRTEAESVRLVKVAYDLGVTLFDTAESYKTAPIVGKALNGYDRQKFVISTKCNIGDANSPRSGNDVVKKLEDGLRELQTDYVDILHMHGVHPTRYEQVMQDILPALEKAKTDGKVRFLGITETSPNDPTHEMLTRAVHDEVWSVIMLGYNMMNQTARAQLFPNILNKKIGTLLMFVVRNIFSQPKYLRQTVRQLAEEGKLPDSMAKKDNPLDFLIHDNGAKSLTDAAYRFVRHEPGVDVVLFGTGTEEHLRENIRSINRGPLPADDIKRLHSIFGGLVGIGFDLPDKGSSIGVIK